jgi:CRP-like cAMP-binding protein
MRLAPELLAPLPSIAALSPTDRGALADAFRGRGYARGELIFEEGDPGTSMLIVADGTLVALSKASGGREVGRFVVGSVIGEASLLDHAPRPVTLRAWTDALVFELDEASLAALRGAHPTVARALATMGMHSLVRRLRGLEEKVDAELTRTSVVW